MEEEHDFVTIADCDGCGRVVDEYKRCVNQHRICNDCAQGFSNRCIECRQALYTAQELRDDNQCPNNVYDCIFTGNVIQVREHVQTCPHKAITCPFNNPSNICEWDGRQSQLSEHFGSKHGDLFKILDESVCSFRDVFHNMRHNIERQSGSTLWQDYCVAFFIEPDMFFLQIGISESGKLICVVRLIGYNEETASSNFKYYIKFGESGTGTGRAVTDKCGQISYISSKDVVVLCNEDGHLPYEVVLVDQTEPLPGGYEAMIFEDFV